MSWQRKEEPESKYHNMALGFLLDRSDLRFEGHCKSCDARQPIYLSRPVESHGKTAIFNTIEPTIPCLFCKTAGTVTIVER